jgi:hypothetical protein
VRKLASLVVGSLVIVVVYVVALPHTSGGPLLAMVLAYGTGIQVARLIWSGVKDSLVVWLIFLAVVLTATYTYLPHYPPPPGASRGGANVEPPPGYVEQPLPQGSTWRNFLSVPYADPIGFAFLLFWVVVFGAYIKVVWGGNRKGGTS